MTARPGAIAAVFRHAWRQQVSAPATSVFMAAFTFALSFGVFVVGGFIDSDHAALDVLWAVLPWTAIVLVPAFAMRAFSGEAEDRGFELAMTMPLSDLELALGTWLAGTALLVIALAATLPIAATAGYLGAPDWGAAGAGYLGAALLLAAYYALALFAAAQAREPVAAYIAAVVLLAVVTLPGTDVAARVIAAPAALLDAAALLSPRVNLERLATGRVELAALFNFAALTVLALAGTAAAIDARRDGRTGPGAWARRGFADAVACVAVLAAMAVVSTVDVAADLTGDRRHTLHPATIAAARAVPEGTALDLYWSESEPVVPARIRAHAHHVARLMATIARFSGGRLTSRTHDTAPDGEAEWSAQALGIQPVPLSSGDRFMLGAVVGQGARRARLPYLDIARAGLLEYDLALAMTRLADPRPKRIGIVSPLLTPSNVSEPREGLSFVGALKQSGDVAIVPFFADGLPDGLDVVIVIGGALVKPGMLAAIERHAAAGKGLIVCLDPYTRFAPAPDAVVPAVTGRGETIADVVDRRGIRFEAAVTGDAVLAAPVAGEDHAKTTYPFWLRVPRAQIDRAHPATASLTELLFAEPGSLTLAAGSAAVPLVTTTGQSGSLPADAFKGAAAGSASARFAPDGQVRTLAAFAPPAIFAVADVDWLFDPVSVVDAGGPSARPLNDNHAFLANMVDAAGGDTRLLAMRARSSADRRFTHIEALVRASSARTRAQEETARAAIARIEATVAEILKAAKVTRVSDLPAEIGARIDQLNSALIPVRRQLSDIRRQAREEVQALARTLTALNLAAGPLLTLAFAGLMFRLRRRS